eukprot:TRINITY_DN1468_c0_g1_i1.p1 TRINITY_DN1468_c0_g1~~TRINITY_DN1468_c0_g1_i1.p1  ORF type:complete len:398 (-),score=81.41 TRINITY_DN1468_c0_g1_i1:96-1289(-)
MTEIKESKKLASVCEQAYHVLTENDSSAELESLMKTWCSRMSETSNVIDMRSDTITKPTLKMRKAMAEAEVGDDVFHEDPTVKKLEEMVATLTGKEAGLFVVSGTMSNLIACLVHCNSRDSEMIVGSESHIHFYEQGGSATLGGIHSRVVKNSDDGTLPLKEIEEKIRSLDDHFPTTKLVCLENTHNRMGGRILRTDYIDSVGDLCKKYAIKLHIDGARLMNAAIALDVSAARLVKAADSVSVCLSKGLAAPVGSVLVGTKDFITTARRVRKSLGGGMRQCGVLAAAGIVSLTDMISRLKEDHANAKLLAKGLSHIPGLQIDDTKVETNIMFVDVDQKKVKSGVDAKTIVAKMKEQGVLIMLSAPMRFRAVLHYHVTTEHVLSALKIFNSVMESLVV